MPLMEAIVESFRNADRVTDPKILDGQRRILDELVEEVGLKAQDVRVIRLALEALTTRRPNGLQPALI